jgi:hypothetical protein
MKARTACSRRQNQGCICNDRRRDSPSGGLVGRNDRAIDRSWSSAPNDEDGVAVGMVGGGLAGVHVPAVSSTGRSRPARIKHPTASCGV